MGKENILKDKSFVFALRIIDAYKNLIKDKKEFVLSKQNIINKRREEKTQHNYSLLTIY
jgi:hypothetical protein